MSPILSDKSVVGPWVARKVGTVWTPESCEAIGLTRDDEMIAGVIYEKWKGVSFLFHMAVDGLMTPEYLAAIFHYPFVHCGVRKVIAPISQKNAKSIRFAENLGFRKEAQLLDAHPDGSLLLYTMSREQCRFIGEEWHGRLIKLRQC